MIPTLLGTTITSHWRCISYWKWGCWGQTFGPSKSLDAVGMPDGWKKRSTSMILRQEYQSFFFVWEFRHLSVSMSTATVIKRWRMQLSETQWKRDWMKGTGVSCYCKLNILVVRVCKSQAFPHTYHDMMWESTLFGPPFSKRWNPPTLLTRKVKVRDTKS